jgi:hypothetical protein
MNTTIKQFSGLLQKYALSRPISSEDQRYIITQSRAGLKRILKQKGSYGAVIGSALAVSFLFRKMGIKLTLIQGKLIAGVTAVAVSAGSAAGGYTTVRLIREKIFDREKTGWENGSPAPETTPQPRRPRELKTDREIRNFYHKLEEINLDDGTRLVGAVISQDRRTARIHTVHGVIEVPLKSIRNIRML